MEEKLKIPLRKPPSEDWPYKFRDSWEAQLYGVEILEEIRDLLKILVDNECIDCADDGNCDYCKE